MAKGFIGHAVASENSNKYGSAGDQTGKEVRYDDWYNEGWNVVLRPKASTVAEKIAKAMEQAVENNAIGYDQKQRFTLYEEAKKKRWQIHLITTKCECDCSSLVAVCVNAAGVNISKDIYTGNMVKALEATGAFEKKLVDKKYLTQSSYLKRGDILIHEGSHTAIVLMNGDKVVDTNNKVMTNNYKEVDYRVTVTAFRLHVRFTPTSLSKSVALLKRRDVVRITKLKGGWGYCPDKNGWISLTYTKKTLEQSLVEPYVAVTSTTVNFRTEPNSTTSKNLITKFNRGQYLLITLERNDGWVYGKTTVDGVVKSGWIFNEYIEKIEYDRLRRRRVTDATGLNIRNSGNNKATCLKTISFNKEFYVLKDSDSWGVVVYEDVLGYSHLSNCYSEKTFYF